VTHCHAGRDGWEHSTVGFYLLVDLGQQPFAIGDLEQSARHSPLFIVLESESAIRVRHEKLGWRDGLDDERSGPERKLYDQVSITPADFDRRSIGS
jgi:hypothetical protein